MAKPPEPLEHVLPDAVLVVEATVREVLAAGTPIPIPQTEEHTSDKGTVYAEQKLVLDVARVLKGSLAGTSVEVTKPVAPYLVKAGVKGAWLLDRTNTVLGRYGPDSWRTERVEAALKRG